MRNRWTGLLAVAGVFCSLTTAASAAKTITAPGTTDPTTTFVVGRGECRDNRILDMSGAYRLEGTTHTLEVGLVQDPRGRLITTATVTLADGSTTGPFQLFGRLIAFPKERLKFVLVSGDGIPDLPRIESDILGRLEGQIDGVPPGQLPPPPTDDPTSGPAIPPGPFIMIAGVLEGPAFHVHVLVKGYGMGREDFDTLLLPRNPKRGYVIEDVVSRNLGRGRFASIRMIRLPWGTTALPAVQTNRGAEIRLQLPPPESIRAKPQFLRPAFGDDIQAVDEAGTIRVRRNQVKLGYGLLESPPPLTTIIRTEFPPNPI
jgi:hypothetical protein